MSDTRLDSEWRVSEVDIRLLNANNRVYAIVEPQLWDKWKFWLYKSVIDPQFASLFSETPYSHIENGPVIMNLSGSSELLSECVSQMEQIPCGCFLVIKKGLDWESVLNNARRSIAVTNERTEALLRYYDPRTLLPLLAVMSDEERFSYFSTIEQFIWHNKKWLTGCIPSFSYAGNPPEKWIMTTAQVERMQFILKQW
ncbi:DUF4123 domain-containing protein [Vibrio salinus]|uniref:DUF4123 domain-containing protein n=1 Tax=Vibrio salinus TaxID=2899784 RepID=UPI001E489486|nr:DUF4123 domain-containing protein [Vibrio salinus]MCE0495090.1 DUF4123 domain-containing protein [Vibrio salinus]